MFATDTRRGAHPDSAAAPARLLGRTALIVLAAFGIIAAVLARLYWSLQLSKLGAGGYSFDVTVVTPPEADPDLSAAAQAQYATVRVVPDRAPDAARTMQVLALSSRFVIGALAALTVAVLAITLPRGRGLGRLTAGWLGVLGALMAVVAIVAVLVQRARAFERDAEGLV